MPSLSPISAEPISALSGTAISVAQTLTIRFATHGFATRPTDTPQNEHIPGRITKGSEVGRHIGIADEGQFGPLLQSRYGDIELANADGVLDEFVNNYFADGREVRVLTGKTGFDQHNRERPDPYSTFQLQYRAIAGEWHFEHDLIRLRLTDLSHRLHDKLQFLRYGGGGGIEGTADIAGLSRPVGFGRVFNAKAQVVDPAILTYQIHAGSTQEIMAVYDRGIGPPTLDFHANFATYPALVAATIPNGKYGTVLSQGFFKLGAIPSGTVTVDFRGDNQGGYEETHAGIIRKMLENYAGFTIADIDMTSFDEFEAVQPAPIGVFFEAGNESTAEEAVALVAFSGGAFVGDLNGLFRVQRLEKPSASPSWTFNDRNILEIERDRLPYGIPWKAWGVGYQVNNTVQTDADLAAGVTQARRQFLEVERRYAYLTNSFIAIAHRTSGGAPLRQSYFINQAQAQQETQRLLELYAVGRALYRVVIKGVLFRVRVGQTVHVRYRRWDLDGGKNFVVVGIDEDINTEATELRLFG